MEKKLTQRIRLSKETLRQLDDTQLPEVIGGDTTSCSPGCLTEATRRCTICCGP